MSQGFIQQIAVVIFVGAVYLLCAVTLIRLILASSPSRPLIKSSLLTTGLFAGAFIACLLAGDVAGLLGALVASIIFCGACYPLHFALRLLWNKQERDRRNTHNETRRTIDALTVQASQASSPEAICARAAKEFDLTRREEDMLVLLTRGFSYSDISTELYLSDNTVKTHIRSLYKKMTEEDRNALKVQLESSPLSDRTPTV